MCMKRTYSFVVFDFLMYSKSTDYAYTTHSRWLMTCVVLLAEDFEIFVVSIFNEAADILLNHAQCKPTTPSAHVKRRYEDVGRGVAYGMRNTH